MGIPYLLEFILVFLLGSALGSFINVVIDRLSRGESIIFGRSYCENCKKKLSFFELIPIFSFIVLGGKCKNCKGKIPARVLFVEIITGILIVFMFAQFLSGANAVQLIFLTIILLIFVAIFFTDFEYGIIPDELVIGFVVLTSLHLLVFEQEKIMINFLSGTILLIFFCSLFLITKKRGMGFGDVKLSFGLGLFLGFPKIIVAMYLAFLTGALVSLILIAWGKKKLKKDTIPFGPFLIFSTVVSYFLGDTIIKLFLSKFLP